MKPLRMHHVGLVMPTLEKAKKFLEQFELEQDYIEYVEAYHAYCLFTKFGEKESPIELVIPIEGKLTEFNYGKGGLHHIALEVKDVEETRLEYGAKGMELLEPTAVRGAGGIMVNFLRPRHGFGVLVEYVEVLKKD